MSETTSKSLIHLTADYQRLMTILMEANGEITPELETELAINQEMLAKKADTYDFIMGRFEAEEAYWKSKADEYARVAKSCANARQRMRDGIKGAMQAMAVTEIVGENTTFKLTESAPKLIIDEKIIPPAFITETVVREIDKYKIKELLKAGFDVTGARLEPVVALRTTIARKTK